MMLLVAVRLDDGNFDLAPALTVCPRTVPCLIDAWSMISELSPILIGPANS